MCASVALGTLPKAASCIALVVRSRPSLGPHNPLLRYSPPADKSEAGRLPQTPCNSSGRCRCTLYADKRIIREDHDLMNATNPADLRTEADDDLLIRYQELDDYAAYAELDYRYRGRLVAYLRRKGGTLREHADDIVQDAIVKFHTKRKTYARHSSVFSLLHKFVRDFSKDHLKTCKREKRDYRLTRPLLESDADRKADPARLEEELDAKTKVDEMLERIAPAQAEAIRLTKIDGHTAESAAAILGTNARAASERVTRGITAMKKLAITMVILFALVGVVFDNCDLDVATNLCTAEEDVDEVIQPGGGSHHDSDTQRRKSRMRLPIWPETQGMTNMTRTTVVNARNSEYDVLIARPSKWGNPFQIGRDGDRERVIGMYEVHIRRRPDLLAALPELVGKRLGCYCKPEACHGDVLVKLLRELFLEV
jgi:RNA polymerase sigma factor (sigma-70 family)